MTAVSLPRNEHLGFDIIGNFPQSDFGIPMTGCKDRLGWMNGSTPARFAIVRAKINFESRFILTASISTKSRQGCE